MQLLWITMNVIITSLPVPSIHIITERIRTAHRRTTEHTAQTELTRMAAHTVRTEEPTRTEELTRTEEPTRAAHRITVHTARNGGTYQNGGYQQQFYQSQGAGNAAYGQNPSGKKEKKRREKRERKPGGFGMKLAKCAALALVFGLVSGNGVRGRTSRIGSDFRRLGFHGGSHRQRADTVRFQHQD